jgi:chromosome segregation ATPase
MPREASITYEQVAATAAEIKAEGRKPTLRTVREVLRQGSMTTIQRHLQRWSEAQPVTPAPAIELPSDLLAAFRRALEQSVTQAQATLASELAEARAALEAITQEAERTGAELEAEQARAIGLEAGGVELATKLAGAGERIAGLEGEVKREREAAEAARVDVAQSRLAGEHHKAECARLQAEVERLTTLLESERGGRHEAEVKTAAATASAEGLVQRLSDYEKRITALESALAEARKAAADTEKEVVRLTGELAACTARLSRTAPGTGTARK